MLVAIRAVNRISEWVRNAILPYVVLSIASCAALGAPIIRTTSLNFSAYIQIGLSSGLCSEFAVPSVAVQTLFLLFVDLSLIKLIERKVDKTVFPF